MEPRQLRIDAREQLRGDERRRRDHDGIRLDLPERPFDDVPAGQPPHGRRPRSPVDRRPLEAPGERGDERVHAAAQAHERRSARLAGRLLRQPSEHAPVLELQRAQVGERRLERELLAVAAVDPRHQRLDQVLVRLAPEPARGEGRDRLVAVGRLRRDVDLGRKPLPALGGEQRALAERLEVGRDHPGQPFRQRVQLVAAPHVAARVLGTAPDQLALEPELLAEADSRAPCARGSCRRLPRSGSRRPAS